MDEQPLDPASIDLKSSGTSKLPFVIAGLAVLLGGGGFAVFKMVRGHAKAKEHAAFMEKFQSLEKDDMGSFWTCLLGKDADPTKFSDNVALQKTLDGRFFTDPANFPDKVINDCAPRLKGIPKKVEELEGPSDYTDGLIAYGKSIDGLGTGAKFWAERAKGRAAERMLEIDLKKGLDAWHASAGAPTSDAIGWDRFLHCAVPGLDKLKDAQALLEKLAKECKVSPAFMQHAKDECAKLVKTTDTKPDKTFKPTFAKFASDDRDNEAWDYCFRLGRKAAKSDDFDQFGKAWAAYLDAGSTVKKVGAENLKSE